MKFPKLVTPMILLALAACGSDGQRLHGEVEHEGTVVTYETWYHPPGIGERAFGGADGVSNRISINGKTITMTGNYLPPEWKDAEHADLDDYGPKFWAEVAEKFKAIKAPKDREDDHKWLYNEFIALRDAPLAPGNKHYGEHALVTSPGDPNLVSHAGPDDDLTEEGEAEESKAKGEEYAEELKESMPGKFWGEDLDPRRGANRGIRPQIREPGYEYKQRLEIWAQAAFRTGFDHSGTIAYTYKRHVGSGEAGWQLINRDGDRACNHGACPRSSSMRLRQVCDSGVVSDWYVIDGECEGHWMFSHLCNDDTSMQINHAQGIWTGKKCPGSKRGIVPKCGRQFK